MSGQIRLFAQAHEAGDQALLVKLALESALQAGRRACDTRHAVEQRLTCGGLDAGARIAIAKAQWLAAFAYLNPAVRPCGDMPSIRSRIAELFALEGDV